RAGDAPGDRGTVAGEGGPVAAAEGQRGGELALRRRGGHAGGPGAEVVGGAGARSLVAGRGRHEHAGGVGGEEGQHDRGGGGRGAARDREVDDVDAVEDRLL